LYYTRDDGAEKNKTLSLRELNLKEEFDLESIFYAVRDAIDAEDLLERIQRLVFEEVEFDQEDSAFIRFVVHDNNGKTNYLKFRKRKEKKQWNSKPIV
jgi:hypothetical protein